MRKSRNKAVFRTCCAALLAAAFTVIGLLVAASETAAQETGRSSIVVVLTGNFRGTTNVDVELKGANLAEPMVTSTFFPGLALFRGLPSGTYAVTPQKEGFAYNPLSQSVTLEDRPFGDRALACFIASVPPLEVPYQELWASSAHADVSSESFNHWNDQEENPDGIPTSCAKCHSTPGFLDFLGEDGTPPGTVDNPAPIGTVIECGACHNDTASSLTSVIFPSGAIVTGIGDEARCMQCHQGSSSSPSVDADIAEAAPATEDTVDPDLSFINIHYYAAAATLYGNVAMGGYQYSGKSYDAKFAHAGELDTCISCHDPHSLELKIESCVACHPGNDLLAVRSAGSLTDYDGDGDITEGIYYEIAGLREKLYNAIQAYAASVAGTAIVYDELAYPYFFIDTDGDGVADPAEANYGNRYVTWTARLVKAAYNYQVSLKDPGAFAHGGKYIIELLYDSIEDLNVALAALTPPAAIDLTGVSRTDEGHFDGSSEAWRHWDEDGAVEADCAKCHSAEGLPIFIENGTNIAAEISNGLLCSTCHENLNDFTLRAVEEVTFPSGLSADLGEGNNLCLNCHQGREAKATVDATIAADPGPYSFINIHYYAAAASLLGADVEAGYEYEGKSYAGQNTFTPHGGAFDLCVDCHMAGTHNVAAINTSNCAGCHGGASFTFEDFRTPSTPDFDGDGDTTESRRSEIQGLETALYAEIQSYAAAQGKPIAYDANTYPYFVNDTNGNGVADPDELSRNNAYSGFDATLLKAAFNYQVSKKEPCGYIHNATYIAQLMVDSIGDLGGSVSAYTWR
jgi:hypothetical protein